MYSDALLNLVYAVDVAAARSWRAARRSVAADPRSLPWTAAAVAAARCSRLSPIARRRWRRIEPPLPLPPPRRGTDSFRFPPCAEIDK